MSEATDSSDTERYRPTNPLIRVAQAVRRSLWLFLAVLGVVFILVGPVIFDGILAGMFGIWGGTFVAFGLVGYGIILLWRRY